METIFSTSEGSTILGQFVNSLGFIFICWFASFLILIEFSWTISVRYFRGALLFGIIFQWQTLTQYLRFTEIRYFCGNDSNLMVRMVVRFRQWKIECVVHCWSLIFRERCCYWIHSCIHSNILIVSVTTRKWKTLNRSVLVTTISMQWGNLVFFSVYMS